MNIKCADCQVMTIRDLQTAIRFYAAAVEATRTRQTSAAETGAAEVIELPTAARAV